MKVFEVNIYIETSIKSPKEGNATGMWLIEFIMKSGEPKTKKGFMVEEGTTENELTLRLIVEALNRLTKSCFVSVNTECGHVLSAVNNKWLNRWESDGWFTRKGKPVANKGLWQELSGLMGKHSVKFKNEWHSYKVFMQAKVKKIQEAMDGEA